MNYSLKIKDKTFFYETYEEAAKMAKFMGIAVQMIKEVSVY